MHARAPERQNRCAADRSDAARRCCPPRVLPTRLNARQAQESARCTERRKAMHRVLCVGTQLKALLQSPCSSVALPCAPPPCRGTPDVRPPVGVCSLRTAPCTCGSCAQRSAEAGLPPFGGCTCGISEQPQVSHRRRQVGRIRTSHCSSGQWEAEHPCVTHTHAAMPRKLGAACATHQLACAFKCCQLTGGRND